MATLFEIRDYIKWESRQESSGILDARINRQINFCIRKITNRWRLPVFRISNFELTLTSNGVLTTPSIQHFVNLQYSLTSSSPNWFDLKPYDEYSNDQIFQFAYFYNREGTNKLKIIPANQIDSINHRCRLDYYRYPVAMSIDSQPLEIPDFENYIVLDVQAALARYENSDRYNALRQDALMELNSIIAKQGFVNG